MEGGLANIQRHVVLERGIQVSGESGKDGKVSLGVKVQAPGAWLTAPESLPGWGTPCVAGVGQAHCSHCWRPACSLHQEHPGALTEGGGYLSFGANPISDEILPHPRLMSLSLSPGK